MERDGGLSVTEADGGGQVTIGDMAEFDLRITDYLTKGGFFNPEAMEHEKVRDLLMDIRDAIRKDMGVVS